MERTDYRSTTQNTTLKEQIIDKQHKIQHLTFRLAVIWTEYRSTEHGKKKTGAPFNLQGGGGGRLEYLSARTIVFISTWLGSAFKIVDYIRTVLEKTVAQQH